MVQPFDIFDLLSDTEEGRRISFQTKLGQSGLVNQNNRPNFSNLFGNFQNQFFGDQGTRVQQGQEPQSFLDFLNNDFNLDRQLRRAPNQQTGLGNRGLTSQARFLFNN